MENAVVEETERQPVAASYEEHVAARTAPVEAPKEETKVVEPAPESPEETGTSTKSDRPKRDRTAEGRIAELNSQLKAEREAREKEVREWREKAERATAPPAEVAKPEVKQPDTSNSRPKLTDFVAQLNGDEPYELAHERWQDATEEWRQKQAKEVESKHQAEERGKQTAAKIAKSMETAKSKFEDFDEVVNTPWAVPAIQDTVVKYMQESEDYEVLYHLAKNPEEVERISALSPVRQLAELGKLEDRLAAKNAPPPAKPPTSRAPAPIQDVSGGSGYGSDDPLEPGISMEEFRRRRLKQKKT